MNEILPKMYHWTRTHPEIGIEVSSYFLEEERVLLDPLMPEEGLEWFQGREPQHVVLTNRLHVRDSFRFRQAFGCTVHVHESGRSDAEEEGEVATFVFGEELPGKIKALEVDAICADETALFIPREGGILAFADGLIREGDAPPGFVEDDLMAETAEQARKVKRGLIARFERVVDERRFDHLFFAHGNPMIGEGQEALRRFLDTVRGQSDE